jgi:hypothetical protein
MTPRDLQRLAVLASTCALALSACGKPAPNAAASANAAAPTPTNAAAASATPAASSGDAADAKAFVEGLYTHYTVDPKTSTWAPMDKKDDAQVFDADMVRLLAADVKAANGEVGAIDADYICGCQDWEPFSATITVVSATPAMAKAAADFRVFKTDQPRHLEFDLVKEKGAWRVHDIRENDQTEQPPGPSLRQTLLAELKSPPKPGAGAD